MKAHFHTYMEGSVLRKNTPGEGGKSPGRSVYFVKQITGVKT